MNILVTGCNGQLGSQFKDLSDLHNDKKFTFVDRNKFDISNYEVVESALKNNRFDCIINCASYTNVDQAENDTEKALKTNSDGAGNLALAAAKTDTFLVHFSTDYVFDGNKNQPYSENDPANPQTVYGISKLKGEKQIIANAARGLIIRTAWLYSAYGNNFVKTILLKGSEKKHLRVVYDQIGSPTFSSDLAYTTLKILPEAIKTFKNTGIYNYSNEGVASWYDIAVAISDIKGLSCNIEPVRSEEFPTIAKRPSFSLLCKHKIKNDFMVNIPYWRHSLDICLKKL